MSNAAADQKPAPIRARNEGAEKKISTQQSEFLDSTPVIAIAFSGDTDIIRDDLAIRNKEDDLSSVKYAAVVAQASPLKKRSASQTAPDCPASVAKVAGVEEVVMQDAHDHKDLPLEKVEPVSLNKAYPLGGELHQVHRIKRIRLLRNLLTIEFANLALLRRLMPGTRKRPVLLPKLFKMRLIFLFLWKLK